MHQSYYAQDTQHLPCHSAAGTHAREPWRHAWEPNDGVRQTSWGWIKECWPKDRGWWASGGQINRQWWGKYVSWMFKTGFGLPGLPAHTGPEHTMQRWVFSSRSSSTELGCFSKPDNSAWLMVSQEWWVRALEAPLVSLSKFISTSVSRLITVTVLWAVLLNFLIVLMQFLLLYYYKYPLMHVHLSCTIYYAIYKHQEL